VIKYAFSFDREMWAGGLELGIGPSQCILAVTDPSDQALASQIAQSGDPTGVLTEALVNSVASKQGTAVLEGGKVGSNNGFDSVLMNSDGTVTLVVDAKQMTNGTFKLGQTADGSLQLSSTWIDSVMGKMDPLSPAYQAVKQASFDGKLSTAVIGVDKRTGQLIGVPINAKPPH